MKVREVLDQVNEVKPNVYSDARLMDFLNEVESMIWNEVLDKEPKLREKPITEIIEFVLRHIFEFE